MRILLLNQVFVGPDEPGHTRHFELAQYLRRRGHELVIVASKLNYQTGRPAVSRPGLVVEQDLGGVRVLRTAVFSAIHRGYIWRILSFFSFMFSSIWASLRVKDVDLVMGTTPPIFQAFSAFLVAFLRRKPFLLEVRDLWPEFAVAMGVLTNPVLIALARWLERFLYARAARILVNSPAYVTYLTGRGVDPAKISCIPYGADVEMFTPDGDDRGKRAAWGLEGQFAVLYAGALGQANDIYTLLRAAARLKEHPEVRFLLVGDGKERPALQAEAARLGLDNLIFAGTVPKKEMPAVLAAADACLAILQDISAFRTTYPNKVFDYMAAGKPTLLAIDGVIRAVIEESGGGVYVPPGDDAALAAAALALSRDPAAARAMGRAARAYLCANLDRRDKLAETQALFEQLGLNQRAPG
jgi:glycosyltransferase involved in cell wall biosynthesis